MEVGLSEKIPPLWQEEGDLQKQLQKVREPVVLRPEGSHQRQLQASGNPNLRQHPRKKAEGWEGIRLQTVLGLQHRIGAGRHRVVHR